MQVFVNNPNNIKMFVKHECPRWQLSPNWLFEYKGHGHKVIDPGAIWRVSLVKNACQISILYLIRFKSYGLVFFGYRY